MSENDSRSSRIEKVRQEVPLLRFLTQVKETAQLIQTETEKAPLLKRLMTAFVGPIEANRMHRRQDGHYEMSVPKIFQYLERNAVAHGYMALLISAISLLSGFESLDNVADSAQLFTFSGTMFVIGLQRLIVGLDHAQTGLTGFKRGQLNNLLRDNPLTVPLDRGHNVQESFRRRRRRRR